jgi:uncharacterized damage-inducible protein DinB
MDKQYFEFMGNFNKKANNLMNNILITLTDEHWKREFTGFYTSIHEICSHIYFTDCIGLHRFTYLHKFTSLEKRNKYEEYMKKYSIKLSKDKKEYLDENYVSWKNIFSESSVDEYIKMRIYLDKKIIKFINEITIDDLDNTIKFTTVTGNKYEKRIDGLLIDLFNHQTHHRGMISVYLDMMGIENEFNDVFYLVHKENKR